jgi:hypothetical protein
VDTSVNLPNAPINLEIVWISTQLTSKVGFFARVKSPWIERSKTGPYSNIDPFSIIQSRGFDAQKNPTFEVNWVYKRIYYLETISITASISRSIEYGGLASQVIFMAKTE